MHASMRSAVRVAVALGAVGVLAIKVPRCTRWGYDAVIRSGHVIPQVERFALAFPQRQEFLTYYRFGYGSGAPIIWNSKAYFGGRFELSMQFQVDLNLFNTQVVRHSEPRFYFAEIDLIEVKNGQASVVRYAGSQELSRHAAEALMTARGDVAKAAIATRSSKAVQNFELLSR